MGVFCLALNSTTVTWSHEALDVKHGPLWWPGRVQLPTREVLQLFVVEKAGSKGGRRYELCVLRTSGHRQTLVRTDDEARARFLELRLEQALGLADERVEGEHRR